MSDAAQPADRPAAHPAADGPGPDGSLGDAGSHFTTQAGGEPAGPGRFVNVDELPVVEFLPGLGFRPVLGQRAMTNFVSFAPGATAPHHVHEEEQIVIVLDGEFTFDLDGDVRTMRKGDVAVIPSWVPHGAWTADSHCLEVDVFCPPRQSLLKLAEAHAAGTVEAVVLNDAVVEGPVAEGPVAEAPVEVTATDQDVVEASGVNTAGVDTAGVDTAGAHTAAGAPASEA